MNQFFFCATRKCRFPATCLWDYVCEKRKEDEDEAYRLNPVPWSPGYIPARTACADSALSDTALSAVFRGKDMRLPRGYGYGLGDRAMDGLGRWTGYENRQNLRSGACRVSSIYWGLLCGTRCSVWNVNIRVGANLLMKTWNVLFPRGHQGFCI